jgi:hypothetical protein
VTAYRVPTKEQSLPSPLCALTSPNTDQFTNPAWGGDRRPGPDLDVESPPKRSTSVLTIRLTSGVSKKGKQQPKQGQRKSDKTDQSTLRPGPAKVNMDRRLSRIQSYKERLESVSVSHQELHELQRRQRSRKERHQCPPSTRNHSIVSTVVGSDVWDEASPSTYAGKLKTGLRLDTSEERSRRFSKESTLLDSSSPTAEKYVDFDDDLFTKMMDIEKRGWTVVEAKTKRGAGGGDNAKSGTAGRQAGSNNPYYLPSKLELKK